MVLYARGQIGSIVTLIVPMTLGNVGISLLLGGLGACDLRAGWNPRVGGNANERLLAAPRPSAALPRFNTGRASLSRRQLPDAGPRRS